VYALPPPEKPATADYAAWSNLNRSDGPYHAMPAPAFHLGVEIGDSLAP